VSFGEKNKSRDGNVVSFRSLTIPLSVLTQYSISSASRPRHIGCGMRTHSHSGHWMEAIITSLRLNFCGKLGTSFLLQATLICFKEPASSQGLNRSSVPSDDYDQKVLHWVDYNDPHFRTHTLVSGTRFTFTTTDRSTRYQARNC